MKRRKVLVKEISEIIDDKFTFTKMDEKIIYQINDFFTTDIAEAVSILMFKVHEDDEVWQTKVTQINNIQPSKCLYWLTGGDIEWNRLNNFNERWSDCYKIFESEFGEIIIDIVNNSNTLGDIKRGLKERVNLLTIYEFSLATKIIQ
jgi:hypothetical protein